MARLEGRIALSTLARRFPDLELAADDFQWTSHAMLRRVAALPVHLGTDRAPTASVGSEGATR
jgi:cytochrome P450